MFIITLKTKRSFNVINVLSKPNVKISCKIIPTVFTMTRNRTNVIYVTIEQKYLKMLKFTKRRIMPQIGSSINVLNATMSQHGKPI